jgi:hypothetical protein
MDDREKKMIASHSQHTTFPPNVTTFDSEKKEKVFWFVPVIFRRVDIGATSNFRFSGYRGIGIPLSFWLYQQAEVVVRSWSFDTLYYK